MKDVLPVESLSFADMYRKKAVWTRIRTYDFILGI
jgi:hypothetical protein